MWKIFFQSFCVSVLFTGIGFSSFDIFGNKLLDNQLNYAIDIVNILITGWFISFMGRKYLIFFAVLIASGFTVIAFIFSFINEFVYGFILWLTRICCVCAFTANKIYCI